MIDQAFIEYLVHFHGTRDYFECHEVLEERWKKDRPLDRESILVGFIQLAVSLYHQRRRNFKGAKRLIRKALQKFHKHEEFIEQFGLDKEAFFHLLKDLENNIYNHAPYISITLPIKDKQLVQLANRQCQRLGCSFNSTSNLENKNLIHKHILRHK